MDTLVIEGLVEGTVDLTEFLKEAVVDDIRGHGRVVLVPNVVVSWNKIAASLEPTQHLFGNATRRTKGREMRNRVNNIPQMYHQFRSVVVDPPHNPPSPVVRQQIGTPRRTALTNRPEMSVRQDGVPENSLHITDLR